MLSHSEIEEIREIIRKHTIAFAFDVLGPSELSREEVRILENAGILYGSGRHLISDSYLYGRLAAILGTSAVTMSYKDVKDAVTALPPMTEIERQAIDYASSSAGQYIRGVSEMMIRDVGSAASRKTESALRMIQDGVSENIAERRTIGQLKTELFNLIDDRDRDWQRIAHTEINTAIQNGIYREIRENSEDGVNQLVFKRPNPDACKYCKALYLKDDGITPKVFRLKDLEDNNFGLKARDWRATIGGVHPWCGCQLHYISDGTDFVKRRTIKEPFEVGGEKHLRGDIINEEKYDKLSEDNKKNIGYSAILEFTGKTASLDTKKSMNNLFIKDVDEPVCHIC